ncbi:MAG: SMP-30/gluconolactonase/LRE family protein [Leptospiraceae bacterium]|nr:SMP-30/gluconolactonase/LRE family protein [Leptospiraceae bacterium]
MKVYIRKAFIYIASILVAMIVLLILFLITTKKKIEPEAFDPPNNSGLVGAWAINDKLEKAESILEGRLIGPEAIAVDKEGNLFTGTRQGWVVKIFPDGRMKNITNTGGRPLGMKVHPDGNLIVCDAIKGLLSIDEKGKTEVLSTVSSSDSIPFKFTDDLDITMDGDIYFTDASYKFGVDEYLFDLLEGKPYGRLLKYDSYTKLTTTVLKDLYFANGVAISSDEDFILINETYRYRIRKYHLKGTKVGKSEIFIDNLPGFPDNITSNRKGEFHLALFTVRNSMMDALQPFPSIIGQYSKLPKFLWTKPKPYGLVATLGEKGEIIRTYHDPTGKVMKGITSAIESDGFLYFGFLYEEKIGRLKLE